MYDKILLKVRDDVSRNDRTSALNLLRSAIQEGTIVPRDGVELMLAVRQGSREAVLEGISLLRRGASGTFRFVPKMEHAFA